MGRFQREGYSIEFNCKIIMMQDFGGEPRWRRGFGNYCTLSTEVVVKIVRFDQGSCGEKG